MSAPICTDCGQPITAQHYDLMCDGAARHELLRECLGVLKRALSAAEADRDRYRAVLVALRDAERALKAASASFAEEAALNAAIDAAIAAVEEG